MYDFSTVFAVGISMQHWETKSKQSKASFSLKPGYKYNSNRGYSKESLHRVFQSQNLKIL